MEGSVKKMADLNIPKLSCDCGSMDWYLDRSRQEHVCLACNYRLPYSDFINRLLILMDGDSDE